MVNEVVSTSVDIVCIVTVSIIGFLSKRFNGINAVPTFWPDYVVVAAVTTLFVVLCRFITSQVLWLFVMVTAYAVIFVYLFKCFYVGHKWHDNPRIASGVDTTIYVLSKMAPFVAVSFFNAYTLYVISRLLRGAGLPNEYMFRSILYLCMLVLGGISVAAGIFLSKGNIPRDLLYTAFGVTVILVTIFVNGLEVIVKMVDSDGWRERHYDDFMISMWMIAIALVGILFTYDLTRFHKYLIALGALVFIALFVPAIVPLIDSFIDSQF